MPGVYRDIMVVSQYQVVQVKVEYHADAEYENPLKDSEKIACVGQKLLYPIMETNNNLPCIFVMPSSF